MYSEIESNGSNPLHKGDAISPVENNIVICHICNDACGWGKGFVLAISKRWVEPEEAYRQWHSEGQYKGVPFQLGRTIFVKLNDAKNITVANMLAQHTLGSESPPIKYDALETCLKEVYEYCRSNNLTLHMPRIGTGLAGGKWEEIDQILKRTMSVETYVYDFS